MSTSPLSVHSRALIFNFSIDNWGIDMQDRTFDINRDVRHFYEKYLTKRKYFVELRHLAQNCVKTALIQNALSNNKNLDKITKKYTERTTCTSKTCTQKRVACKMHLQAGHQFLLVLSTGQSERPAENQIE